MTKREIIALRAMQAIITKAPNIILYEGEDSTALKNSVSAIVTGAFTYADAFIKHTNKKPKRSKK